MWTQRKIKVPPALNSHFISNKRAFGSKALSPSLSLSLSLSLTLSLSLPLSPAFISTLIGFPLLRRYLVDNAHLPWVRGCGKQRNEWTKCSKQKGGWKLPRATLPGKTSESHFCKRSTRAAAATAAAAAAAARKESPPLRRRFGFCVFCGFFSFCFANASDTKLIWH